MAAKSLLFFKRMFRWAPLGLFLLLAVGSAGAQERGASRPTLPLGYSSIRVYDREGRFVGRILPTQKYWVSIDRIPVFLQNALVAIEDSRFYEHNGIDVRGIARALVKDVIKRRMAEGGSTITQQLIKNRYLSSKKTFDRKFQEGLLAVEFEKKYSKKQILEMYFNEINFGNGAWGIAQAARLYFDKSPEELTDAECSLLAGVPKAPAVYNPLGNKEKINTRRNLVLSRMVDLNMITPQQKQNLVSHPAAVFKSGGAPYYMAHIKDQLIKRYGSSIVEQGGLDVIAAMDLNLQNAAEKTLREGVKKISPKLQGALICEDTATGDILAAVGGVDSAPGSFNRAFFARRQPGSAIKPLIYAAALEKGYTASTLISDQPVSYNGWKPINYERTSYGDLTLRQALAHSNNVIAVKLLNSIGVPNFVNFAATMGLPLKNHADLSLALGTEEVTLRDLVAAYTPLANGGMRSEPRSIIRIYDRRLRAWNQIPPAVTPVLAPATAFVTTQMLKDVMVYGTAKNLKKFSQQRPSAGKTGTTSDYRDAWFVGYTPQMVTGVWVGYDRPKPGGKGFTGGAISAPIWGRFMRTALASKPAVDFPKPDNVMSVYVDPATGQPAAPDALKKREEFFLVGTEPGQNPPKAGVEEQPQPSPVAPAAPADSVAPADPEAPADPAPQAPIEEEQQPPAQ